MRVLIAIAAWIVISVPMSVITGHVLRGSVRDRRRSSAHRPTITDAVVCSVLTVAVVAVGLSLLSHRTDARPAAQRPADSASRTNREPVAFVVPNLGRATEGTNSPRKSLTTASAPPTAAAAAISTSEIVDAATRIGLPLLRQAAQFVTSTDATVTTALPNVTEPASTESDTSDDAERSRGRDTRPNGHGHGSWRHG